MVARREEKERKRQWKGQIEGGMSRERYKGDKKGGKKSMLFLLFK